MTSEPDLCDVEDRLHRFSDIRDQLEAYPRLVDFEIFSSKLVSAVN